ncbi:MAG TPA: DMT family transporter [Roseiflexaceae bacterium]|nr:DMT family transporter [Roseiflexaceae bacterium]
MNRANTTIRGVSFLVLSLLIFSLQDIAIKWIGGDYPVSEIVLFRSIVALPAALLFVRAEGQRGFPNTRRWTLEYGRGLCLLLSFTTYMLGLAALPLADVAAIRYSGPLMITALSVLFLGERVEPRRWLALLVGFIGVLLDCPRRLSELQPWLRLCPTLRALLCALGADHAPIAVTDSSATLAYYSSLVYVVASAIMAPLTLAVGEVGAHPSVAFLFRAWSMPTLIDWAIMSGLGLVWASGMYLMARAYSLAQAAVVAPFEYATLPINAIWSFLLWREVPTATTWIGALLTVVSGIYIVYREQREQTAASRASASSLGAPAQKEIGDHGHHSKRLAAVRQRAGRLVHRRGADRPAVPGARPGAGAGRQRDVRARRPHGLAHPPAGPDPDHDRGLRLGAA